MLMIRAAFSGVPFFWLPFARAIMRFATSCATKNAPSVFVRITKS